ncbi:MAG: tRNA epoxyqueuosine(34) reductase QueG [Alphaproteobacteria bacterium]|nr:tRNA epoxyqueuosine(34) reductase QueG [Alphaproteobacteria bacterium]MCY4231765.1 tRNA epoxyqueuosine(34) reductase QueG [Alphaproteobacteria bacterium]MCY4319894.1 tRNA epoxyqueuosine(34) reductase QueG [Alphaproteobacteria bacterium]
MATADPAPPASTGPAAIRDQALRLGFDAVGFAPAVARLEVRQNLQTFLSEGRYGDMGWLAVHQDRRASPDGLWPEAQTVIVLAMSYGPAGDPLALLSKQECGAVSVYARTARDYHDVLKRRLKRLACWLVETHGGAVKVFVDTAPVMEKPTAEAAGLGWQGKHTNLVSRRHGSWLFLGEIFTTLALTPDLPHEDRCGSCRACLDACPTDAFTAPYQLEPRRCISYLTIEHKAPIPHEFRRAMGNRIYGCDDCLAACPWNKFAARAREPDLMPRIELTAPKLADLAELDEAGFRQVFSGSPIKRTGRNRFLRNVLVAVGNSGDPGLIPTVKHALDDAAPLVRGAAVWALGQLLSDAEFNGFRRARLPAEIDESVRLEWSYGDSSAASWR